ncbi:MAG TPA: phosphoglycolate phosphatase, partial [Epsilonproteobacteria bacterium]|nr:phosphoglycolate phosphatase [Campylobacterota bacterium]
MKIERKEAILFDLDGTLIDSVPDLAAAVNGMLKRLGREGFSEDVIRYWVGNGAQMLVKRALSGSREADETLESAHFTQALEIFLEIYGEHLAESTVAYEGVYDTLKQLQEAGYRSAIVTNKPYHFVEPLLKYLELEAFFEFWLGGDSLERKKPDPLPIQAACARLGLPADRCVMVGDSSNDILAAKAAGMQSIGV